MLLIFRPFRVGDVVSVAGITGKVVEIDLFTTQFDTPDNRRLVVPNGAIFGSTIENVTFHPTRRVDVDVGTDYGADLRATRTVLEEVATATEGVLEEPAPQVYLKSLGASSIDWAVRVWTETSEYWAVRERITQRVKEALDAAEIGIPFPQMDIHVDGVANGEPARESQEPKVEAGGS
jgi:small conductance mechanosensitive channel